MKKLYIIAGFLGSGKTTLLKELFKTFNNEKIAVIVNEYGTIGVDGTTLESDGIKNIEITGGSIFCVCKKDKFLEAINLAYQTDCETIIVESSGLSDPLSTDEILVQYKSIYDGDIECCGVICVIDCKNFHKVINTAVSVENQVKSADLFVLNKTDLVDKIQISEIKKQLISINPTAKIIETTYGKISKADFLNTQHIVKVGGNSKKDLLNSKLYYEFENQPTKSELLNFIYKINAKAYRIKGFVKTTTQTFAIECVMGELTNIEPCDYFGKSFLVILYHSNQNIKKLIEENFSNNPKAI